MATRSSSACVALNNMRFIFSFSRTQASTGWAKLLPPAPEAMRAAGYSVTWHKYQYEVGRDHSNAYFAVCRFRIRVARESENLLRVS